ncbi:ribose 5-phosphate isomerase B [Geochorda subterranea]|uniref:Ribose 5-phosphate isomerase B n=1 Tax=Geochorda subterranea TaxID=3109564 RepID=A0ABZ1BQ40_9FIRM|nr:ribose 5-phosphate isomerase B [Limnochorda sp. LNt]WRP14824.1 ribose 5-phosphate isomerase B [Limnochorda sp. LNt]
MTSFTPEPDGVDSMPQTAGRGGEASPGGAILFVCSGNTCRSPLAAALFRKAWREKGGAVPLEAESAGLSARDGEPASQQARQVAQEWGVDLASHRARLLTRERLVTARLVLTMTEDHKRRVLAMAPEMAGRVYTLGEYAGSPRDVEDPFGQELERYRATARELESLTRLAASRLERESRQASGVRAVAVGWDHAGRLLRDAVVETLREEGWVVEEHGPAEGGAVDYPDVALEVARAVAAGRVAFGVLMCGTGIGMSIAANKVRGVRAALCHDPYSARMARAHNDANLLAIGGRVVGPAVAAEVVRAFARGSFEGGRHARRVDKIARMEDGA